MSKKQPREERPVRQCLSQCTEDFSHERPICSTSQSEFQAIHRGQTQHSTKKKDIDAGTSKLIGSNPFSRSSKMIKMALQKNLQGNDISDDEDECNVSTSELVPLADIHVVDFSPNTSFSEYVSPIFPPRASILITGNTLTNVHGSEFEPLPAVDYLDLSTGNIKVVGLDPGTMDPPIVDPGTVDPPIVDPGTVDPPIVDPGTADPPIVDPGTVDPPIVNPGTVDPPVVDPPIVDPPIVGPPIVGPPIVDPEQPKAREVTVALDDATSGDPAPGGAAMEDDKTGDASTGDSVNEISSQSKETLDETEYFEQGGNDDAAAAMDAVHEELGTKKKRKANQELWERKVNKKKRESGKEYIGREYTSKEEFTLQTKTARSMGTRCGCKTSYTRCSELSDKDREKIFETVWDLDWAEKQHFVSVMTHKKDVLKRTTKDTSSSRRNDTLVYILKTIDDKKIRVCKKMFLSTTGLTDYFVRTYADVKENSSTSTASSKDKPGQLRSGVLSFLQSLPVVPSHYCRKDSNKIFLEPVFQSLAEVLRVYHDFCKEKRLQQASRTIFMEEFTAQNYAIFKPRKDQCDTCVAFDTGNLSEEDYTLHRLAKDAARKEMEADILLAQASNGSLKVITMDLQCVLLCPALKVSALYYRTKLSVHNFTVYDSVSADVKCYVWHEAEGGLSSNEFSSCLLDYLVNDSSFEKCIVWSDGCTYQNRNAVMSKTLVYFAQQHGKTIEQKILIKGHTQMRVDSVHSCIQRAIGQQPVFCPADYIRIMEGARKKPKPYDVKYIDHTFFQNFTQTSSLKSIRPGSRAGDPHVVDIRALQYASDGVIRFKLNFTDDWKPLPNKRGESTATIQAPVPLHATQIPIKGSKFRHLQELKPYNRADFHAFYDALPHD